MNAIHGARRGLAIVATTPYISRHLRASRYDAFSIASAVLNRMLLLRSLDGLVARVNGHPTDCAMCRASSILLSRSLDLRPLHAQHAEPRHHRAIGTQQAQYISIPLYAVAVGQPDHDTY